MMERKKLVIFGTTGTGKSTLCTVLLSGDPTSANKPFKASPGAKGCTENCQAIEGFFCNQPSLPVRIIDTPGFGDIAGKAEDLEKKFFAGLKNEKEVHAFIWAKNSSSERFDGQDEALFKIMFNIFGADFLTHLIIVLTRFSHDPEAKRKREMSEVTLKVLQDGYKEQLGLMNPGVPTDAVLIVDIDALFNPKDNNQREMFAANCEKLIGRVQILGLTPAQAVKDVKAKRDALKAQIADLEERMKSMASLAKQEAQIVMEALKAHLAIYEKKIAATEAARAKIKALGTNTLFSIASACINAAMILYSVSVGLGAIIAFAATFLAVSAQGMLWGRRKTQESKPS